VMKRGDIVLIRWPFSDLSSDKVRPALIISSDKYTYRSEDAVFLFISSKTQNPQLTDLVFDQTDPEFYKSGLKKSSLIKTTKVEFIRGSQPYNNGKGKRIIDRSTKFGLVFTHYAQ